MNNIMNKLSNYFGVSDNTSIDEENVINLQDDTKLNITHINDLDKELSEIANTTQPINKLTQQSKREITSINTHKPINEKLYNIISLDILKYNDVQSIGIFFRENNVLVLNLTNLQKEESQRIVDFCSGLIFGLKGKLEKITHNVIMLTPSNINIEQYDLKKNDNN